MFPQSVNFRVMVKWLWHQDNESVVGLVLFVLFLFNVAVNIMKVILATMILQTIGVQVLPHRDMTSIAKSLKSYFQLKKL